MRNFIAFVTRFAMYPWAMAKNRVTTGNWCSDQTSGIGGNLGRSFETLISLLSLSVQINLALLAYWFITMVV